MLFDTGKGASVADTGAISGDRITMLLTAVALMPGKTVLWEKSIIGDHDPVTHHLGND
jgi:hypothetical protein